MKRVITLGLIAISVVACGSDKPEAANAPTTTQAPAPTSAAAPTTTAAPTATVAPTTTAAPQDLSREARLAVLECLKALGPNSKDFVGFLNISVGIGTKALDDLTAAQTACDEARTQMLADNPQAGDPGSDLAIAEDGMNSAFQLAKLHLLADSSSPLSDDVSKLVQDAVDAFALAAIKWGIHT